MIANVVEHGWQMLLFAALLAGPVPMLLMLRKYFAVLSMIERVIAYGVMWSAAQVTVGQILGHLGRLKLEYFLVVYAVMFIIFVIAKGRDRLKLDSIFARWALWPGAGWLDKILLVLLGVLALGLTVMVLTQPATDYDSLSYHLPTIAKWYGTASLSMEKWKIQSYYPYNWEILGAVAVLPFQEDFAVALPGVFAWGLFGLSVWAIAAKMNVPARTIVGSLGLILTMPVMMKQINTLYVDLPLAAYFLAGFAFILAYRQTGRFSAILLWAVTIGMLIGLKTSGLAYGGLLILISGVSIGLRTMQTRQAVRGTAALKTLGLAVAVMLVGGGWYVRNFIETGNPLAPIRIEVAGRILFPGTVASAEIGQTSKAAQFDFGSQDNWQAFGGEFQAELGVQTLILLAIGLPGLAVSLIRYRRGDAFGNKVLLLMSGILTLVVFWYMPYSAYTGAFRYALPAWGLCGVIGAAGLQSLRVSPKLVMLAGIAVCSWTLYHLSPYLLGLGVLLAGLLIARQERPGPIKGLRGQRATLSKFLLIVVVLASVLAGSLAVRRERDAQREIAYGPIQAWMNANVTRDDLIGYVLCPDKYLLYGTHLDRRVTYLPPASAATQAEWISLLRQQGITFFATGPLSREWLNTPEIGWLQDERYFERVWGEDTAHQMVVYQLRSAR